MTSPTPTPNEPNPNPNRTQGSDDDWDFAAACQAVEQSLSDLRQRYREIEQNQALQAQLRERAAELKKELRRTPSYERSRRQPLRDELRHIQEQLDTIELNLESQLFSLSSLKEPFWQAIRFGGLGLIIGWILKSCAG